MIVTADERNTIHQALAVLTKDYLGMPVDEIGGIHSLLTMVGGRAVYAEGPFAKFEERR